MVLLLLFMAIHRAAKNLSAMCTIPAEVEQGHALPSCFSSALLLQISVPRTSLAVQWLRLQASTEGDTGLILGQGTRIPHTTWCGQKKLNKCPLHGLSCIMFHTHAFGWWFQCLRWFPSTSAFLSARKAVMSLVEKMHVSDKLSSSMSYSAVHHEFNVTVSTTWNKVPFNRNKVMHWSVGNILWQKLTGT